MRDGGENEPRENLENTALKSLHCFIPTTTIAAYHSNQGTEILPAINPL